MRVVVLSDVLRQPLTGIGRYTFALATICVSNEIVLHLWQSGKLRTSKFFEVGETGKNSSLRGMTLATFRRFPRLMDALQRFLNYVEYVKLSNVVIGTVVHGPDFHVPNINAARVVTIHDLSVFSWPQCHPVDRVVRKQRMIRESVEHAHRIITDSHYIRKELLEQFDLSADRVVVIPLACDARFSTDAMKNEPPHSLGSKCYGLFVGNVEPRKNLDTLLSAWESLPETMRFQFPLVVAGGPGWKSDVLHLRMKKAEAEGWLRYLGYVDDDLLPALYAHARVFCFPSWYEGFGLPVLEAMSCGTPVICSSSSCLAEVGGDAVCYVPPDDVEGWSLAICKVLSNREEAQRLFHAGISQAALFSWVRTVELTHSVYRDALDVYKRENKV